MQIIKGIAIAAVLIIAGLLALIVAAYLALSAAACGADTTIYAAGTYWEMQDYKARKQ